MKRQNLCTNNTGKFCLYGLCFFLIFLLSLTFSSIVMAQGYDWGNSQNLLNFDWVYDLDMYSWSNNLSTPSAPVFTSEQGRSGFQAQAPQGIQVLSARSKYTLYSFWSRPAQDQWVQSYYPIYQNPYQPSPYPMQTSSPYLKAPLMPFYDNIYWHPTASYSPIGPSMFYDEPYWIGLGGLGSSFSIGSSHATESSGSIGPSMLYGEAYWHPGYGGIGLEW
jgi:hypothetical protein